MSVTVSSAIAFGVYLVIVKKKEGPLVERKWYAVYLQTPPTPSNDVSL